MENAEISKKNKFLYLNKNNIYLENLNISESKKELNNIIEKNIEFFSNDLKIGQNLVFLAKILFNSIEKNKIFSIKKQFDSLIKKIKNYFEKENFDNFKIIINNNKNIFLTYLDDISVKEIKILIQEIKTIFKSKITDGASDFDKIRNFIKKNIEFSGLLKRFITIDKINNPDNYIDINKTLDNIENINKNISSNESEFVLSLVGKYLEKNGTNLNIIKKKNKILNKIELTSIQNLFTLGNQKKFELHFDFGEEKNKEIMSNDNYL